MEAPTKAYPFMMASFLSSYPNEDVSDACSELAKAMDLASVAEPHGARLKQLLDDKFNGCSSSWDDLRSEYIDLFDRGAQSNSLHETEYGRARSLVKGGQLADIAGFYQAFGFSLAGPDSGATLEMLDHVAVEFEFYALLVMKEAALADVGDTDGAEIVHDARKKFLECHLGRFLHAVSSRPGVVQSAFYSEVFGYCRSLVDEECRRMNVRPTLEGWIDAGSESAEEGISCGAGQACGISKST